MGGCKQNQENILQLLILLLCFIIPIVLITITSIYLRYRIIKSNNFFHSVKRSAAQQRKSHKAGRLAEILQEQVKPTVAVFCVGGIDAVVDILLAFGAVVSNFFSPSSTVTYILLLHNLWQPLFSFFSQQIMLRFTLAILARILLAI